MVSVICVFSERLTSVIGCWAAMVSWLTSDVSLVFMLEVCVQVDCSLLLVGYFSVMVSFLGLLVANFRFVGYEMM